MQSRIAHWLTSIFTSRVEQANVPPSPMIEIGSIKCNDCGEQFLIQGMPQGLPSFCCYCGVEANRLISVAGTCSEVAKPTSFSTPKGGMLTINDDGTYSYEPAPGFVGTEEVTYSIDDGKGGQKKATYFLSVYAPPLQPKITALVAKQKQDNLSEHRAASTSRQDPLSKVREPLGTRKHGKSNPIVAIPNLKPPKSQWPKIQLDSKAPNTQSKASSIVSVNGTPVVSDFTPTEVTTPNSGKLRVSCDGHYSYEPHAEFVGTEEISFTIDDGSGFENTSKIYIAVFKAGPQGKENIVSTSANKSVDGNVLQVGFLGLGAIRMDAGTNTPPESSGNIAEVASQVPASKIPLSNCRQN